MHLLGYKVGRKTFVVNVKVNHLAYAETATPKRRVFCILTRQTYSLTTLATDSQILQLLLNYF
jgi:hypothetical protein